MTVSTVRRYASLAALAIFATFPTVLPTAARAQVPEVAATERTGLVVQGSAEVTVKPDLARLNLGVRTEATSSQQAAQMNANRTDAVIKALRTAGVAENDIQTVDYNVRPQIQYPGDRGGTPKTTGYVVENTVRVTVRKLDDAGTILDAALKAGANLAGAMEFDANEANHAKAREEALTRAVAAAQVKAVALAKAAKAGRITLRGIVEDGAEPVRPMFMGGAAAMRAEAAPTPVQPGEITVRANVTLHYAINPDLAANY